MEDGNLSEQKNRCPHLTVDKTGWVCKATDWGVTMGEDPEKIYGHVLTVEVPNCCSELYLKCPMFKRGRWYEK